MYPLYPRHSSYYYYYHYYYYYYHHHHHHHYHHHHYHYYYYYYYYRDVAQGWKCADVIDDVGKPVRNRYKQDVRRIDINSADAGKVLTVGFRQ